MNFGKEGDKKVPYIYTRKEMKGIGRAHTHVSTRVCASVFVHSYDKSEPSWINLSNSNQKVIDNYSIKTVFKFAKNVPVNFFFNILHISLGDYGF